VVSLAAGGLRPLLAVIGTIPLLAVIGTIPLRPVISSSRTSTPLVTLTALGHGQNDLVCSPTVYRSEPSRLREPSAEPSSMPTTAPSQCSSRTHQDRPASQLTRQSEGYAKLSLKK
jgi:hypothetical protein